MQHCSVQEVNIFKQLSDLLFIHLFNNFLSKALEPVAQVGSCLIQDGDGFSNHFEELANQANGLNGVIALVHLVGLDVFVENVVSDLDEPLA